MTIKKRAFCFVMSLLFFFHFFSFGLISFAEDFSEPTESQSYEERLLDYFNKTEAVALSIPGAPSYTAPAVAAGFVVLYMTLKAGEFLVDLTFPNEFTRTSGIAYYGCFCVNTESDGLKFYSSIYPADDYHFTDTFSSSSGIEFIYAYSSVYSVSNHLTYASNNSIVALRPLVGSDNFLSISIFANVPSRFFEFSSYSYVNPLSISATNGTLGTVVPVLTLDPSVPLGFGTFYLSPGKTPFPDIDNSSLDSAYNGIVDWAKNTFPDFADDPEFLEIIEQVNPSQPEPTEPTDPPIIVNPPQIPAVTFPDYTLETYDVPEQAAQGIGFWFTLFGDMLTQSGLIWLVVLVGCIFLIYYILRW